MNMLYSIHELIDSIDALRRPKDGTILQPPKRVIKIRKEIRNLHKELEKARSQVFKKVAWDKDQAESFYHLFQSPPPQSRKISLIDNLFYFSTEAPSIISRSVEQLRGKGDIFSAIHMQRSLANMLSYGSSSIDYVRSLSIFEKLQEEFWNNNQQVLKYLRSDAKVPEKLIQPFLHDNKVSPPKTYLGNILKGRDVLGRTPLHTTTENWDYLHDSNFFQDDSNVKDIFGRTPLHIICSLPTLRHTICPLWSDHVIRLVQLSVTRRFLCRDSVDIHVRDCDGRYAVEYAILDRRPEVLRLFRDEYEYFEPESEIGRLVLEALKDMEDMDASFSSSDGM